MPDGKEWMCQNLDYVSAKDGIVVGTNCWYYDNNQSTYGWNGKKYGLLYTWNAAMAINIDGWHVPNYDEWTALINAVVANAGTKLKSTYDWSSGAGTDDYGFGALPASYYYNVFGTLGSNGYLWSSSEYSSSDAWRSNFNTSSSIGIGHEDKNNGFSVHLVKNT